MVEPVYCVEPSAHQSPITTTTALGLGLGLYLHFFSPMVCLKFVTKISLLRYKNENSSNFPQNILGGLYISRLSIQLKISRGLKSKKR